VEGTYAGGVSVFSTSLVVSESDPVGGSWVLPTPELASVFKSVPTPVRGEVRQVFVDSPLGMGLVMM